MIHINITSFLLISYLEKDHSVIEMCRSKYVITQPATRRCGEVVTTSLCTSQRRCRYVPNETPNNVSVDRRQYVTVVVFTTTYWYVVMTSHGT